MAVGDAEIVGAILRLVRSLVYLLGISILGTSGIWVGFGIGGIYVPRIFDVSEKKMLRVFSVF